MKPHLANISQVVAKTFGVRQQDLYSKKRPSLIAEARHAVFYIALQLGHRPKNIASHFHRDQSTLVNARKRAIALEQVDPGYREKLDHIRRAVHS